MADVRVEVDGTITTIWLDRPDRRNAVDRPMAAELRSAFEEFEADPGRRVAVLAGSGGTFCASADLTAVADPARRNELDPDGAGGGPMGPTRLQLGKPLIAVPDERWGERPLATVVLNHLEPATPAELRDFLARRLPRWQLPERWSFVAQIPKTSVGKFDEKAIRRHHADGELTVQLLPGSRSKPGVGRRARPLFRCSRPVA